MSTIPSGCFVAPDSLRRLNQLHKQHAREAKMQQASAAVPESPRDTPPISPLVLPPTDQGKTNTFAQLITTPFRLGEIFGRSRSMSSPQPTPPATPPLSPKFSRYPPQDPIPIPQPQHRTDDANDLNRRSHAGSV